MQPTCTDYKHHHATTTTTNLLLRVYASSGLWG